jgi:hypothetical protein
MKLKAPKAKKVLKTTKVPKIPKAKKVIKGSGESKSSQSYLSLANPNKREIVFKPFELSPSKKLLKLSPINEEDTSYNPYKPPKYFTYEILVHMFYDQLLNNEAKKLQGNARAIAEEIAKKIKKDGGEKANLADYSKKIVQSAFNEIIESKIKECIQNLLIKNKINKELLRVKLWNILYTINFGYDISKIPNDKEIKEDFENKAIDNYIKKKVFSTGKSGLRKNLSIGGMSPSSKFFSSKNRPPNYNPDAPDVFEIEDWNPDTPRASPKSSSSSSLSKRSSSSKSMPDLEPPDPDPEPHQNIVTGSRYFVFPWIRLLGYVFRNLCNIFKPTIAKPQQQEATSPDLFNRFALHDETDDDKMLEGKRRDIQAAIIKSYNSNQDKQEIIRKAFDNFDIDYEQRYKVNYSIWYRLVIDEEVKGFDQVTGNDVLERKKRFYTFWRRWDIFNQYYDKYYNNPIYNMTIYSPSKQSKILSMYFPSIFTRQSLLSEFFSILTEFNKLNVFVNLHDCETIGLYDDIDMDTQDRCNPYDRFAMQDMFFLADKLLRDLKIIDNRDRKYITIKNLQSMKAGDLYTWYQINKIPKSGKKNILGIYHHIQPDQSATIILFLLLRDAPKKSGKYWKDGELSREYIKFGLKNKLFGLESIREFIDFFKNIFNKADTWPNWDGRTISRDVDFELAMQSQRRMMTDNEVRRARERREIDKKKSNEFKKEALIFFHDIFTTTYIWQIKLLRQRLNRIFYFLAKKHNIQDFYLYTSPRDYKYSQPKFDHELVSEQYILALFSISVKVKIDWSKVGENSWEKHQRWVDGNFD